MSADGGKQVRVFSIFRSIQGESTCAGLPCVFVRLAGCPLSCIYCDTLEARTAPGTLHTVDEVLEKVDSLGPGIVEVTGGEPLAQEGCVPLLRALVDTGRTVLLETSGAFPISSVPDAVNVVMDLKTPGSGMSKRNLPSNLEEARRRGCEVKVVVTDRGDFDWAVSMVRDHDLLSSCQVIVSPCAGSVAASDLAEWILSCGLNLRLGLQLHKVVWPYEEGER